MLSSQIWLCCKTDAVSVTVTAGETPIVAFKTLDISQGSVATHLVIVLLQIFS